MTIKDIIEKTTWHFKQKGFATARLDAETLFGFVLKLKRIELYLHFEKPLSEVELEACRQVVRRRTAGEPVAYITGTRDFYKSTFSVGPGVLIPRPETEQLVEFAAEWLQKKSLDQNIRILDIGAGSGCISLSLAKDLPSAQVIAIEKSQIAARYFKENQENLSVTNVRLIESDVRTLESDSEKIIGEFDLVVSNPPYISSEDPNVEPNVKRYEPSEALFAGEAGLIDIKEWSRLAHHWLKPGGLCLFEIGSTQGESSAAEFSKIFSNVKVTKDYSGHDRIVSGEKRL